jgi:hypothetical protein
VKNSTTNLSKKPFLRIALLDGELLAGVPTWLFRKALIRLSANGVPYGGGFLDLAASQSNGVEDEIEGVDDGGVEIL